MSRLFHAAATVIERDVSQPQDKDCCVFARLVLRRTYPSDMVDSQPIWRWHLWRESGAGPWEPVLAAADSGLGVRVNVPVLGRWHLCQGWRGTPFQDGVTGHTFLYRPETNTTGIVLDSTGIRGPSLYWSSWKGNENQFRGGIALAALHPAYRMLAQKNRFPA